jgi:hypothetical protein
MLKDKKTNMKSKMKTRVDTEDVPDCVARVALQSTASQALLAVIDTTSTVTRNVDALSSADPRAAPYAGARNDLPV